MTTHRRWSRAPAVVAVSCTLAATAWLPGAPARADTWGSLEPSKTCSNDGRSCVEMLPAPWVENDDETAWALVTVRDAANRAPVYRRFALQNPVAPVGLLIADEGRFLVTLDDWARVGHGERVVVIYDSKGSVVRSLALADLLTPSDVEQLPHSVSSIHWRSASRIDDAARQLVIEVPTCPRQPSGCDQHAELRLDLATGQRVGAFESFMPPARPLYEPARVSIAIEESAAWEAKAREAGFGRCADGVDPELLPESIAISAATLLARLVDGPLPARPEIADKARIQGTIVLDLTLSPAGEVLCIATLKTLPMGVEEATIRTLFGWQFGRDSSPSPRIVSGPIAIRFEETHLPTGGR